MRRSTRLVWGLNAVFLACTALFYWTSEGPEWLGALLHFGSLEFERNLATFWEGACFLVVAALAFERSLDGAGLRSAWACLALLAAGLSLDELGSVHERADLIFAAWDLSELQALVPFALPALALLVHALLRFFRLERPAFWRTLVAFALFGSVVAQEQIEAAVSWPGWSAAPRAVLEEGSELLGVYLLLTAARSGRPAGASALDELLPGPDALARLRLPAAALALAGFVPLALVSVGTRSMQLGRGVPATFLPFALLALAAFAASRAASVAQDATRRLYVLAGVLAFAFALDQIVVLPGLGDPASPQGLLPAAMAPVLALAALAVEPLRTRANALLLAASLASGILATAELAPGRGASRRTPAVAAPAAAPDAQDGPGEAPRPRREGGRRPKPARRPTRSTLALLRPHLLAPLQALCVFWVLSSKLRASDRG